MMRYLSIALYLATLGFWFYGWSPNIDKIAFVDGKTVEDISAGWAGLWAMKGLLLWFCASFGVLILFGFALVDSRLTDIEDKKKETKHRVREQAIEKRGQEIMAQAREQVAEAEREVEHYKQETDRAKAELKKTKARAVKTREESEQAHRNVREQLKRLKQQNAKLNGT